MSSEKITTQNITFPEVEKLLVDTRSELLESARRDGKYAGLKNVPPASDPSSSAYLLSLKTTVEQKRSEALTILQPDMHSASIERINAKLKEQEDEITSGINGLEHLNDVERRELEGKCPPKKRPSMMIGWILNFLIAITDIAFNAAAFEALGDSLGMAIIIAVGAAVATALLATGVVFCLRRAFAGDRKYFAFAAGLFAIALSGFAVFSGFRSNEQLMNDSGSRVSPITFLVLNLFFFTAAIVICVRYFPEESQHAEERAQQKRCDEITIREKEIQSLKEKLSALKEKAAEERKHHLAILSYTVHTMNRFRSVYMEAAATWKSTNLLSRPDRSMPVSFSETIPELDPLQFNLPPVLNLNAA